MRSIYTWKHNNMRWMACQRDREAKGRSSKSLYSNEAETMVKGRGEPETKHEGLQRSGSDSGNLCGNHLDNDQNK